MIAFLFAAVQRYPALRASWNWQDHAGKGSGDGGRRQLHQRVDVQNHFEGESNESAGHADRSWVAFLVSRVEPLPCIEPLSPL